MVGLGLIRFTSRSWRLKKSHQFDTLVPQASTEPRDWSQLIADFDSMGGNVAALLGKIKSSTAGA
jgi:hypothetical protein